MKLYRYLSGIYHFFDSFGKCGKKGGIGMVLVFGCFDCLGRGGRPWLAVVPIGIE